MSDKIITPPEIKLPPTQEELPYDDGMPMESQRHINQMYLLINSLQPWLAQRDDGFVGGNMFVYFSLSQVRNNDFRGPDFFAVLGVPKKERLSWVVWEEGKAPDVIIELLSQSTAKIDKNEKKLVYQNRLRVPEYFWYDVFNPNDWEGFSLNNGVYQPITKENDRMICNSLGLNLVRWQGMYKDISATWLRWENSSGELLPLPEEIAEIERNRAETERNRANAAESRISRIAINLLKEGMSLEQVAEITGLSKEEIQALSN